MIELIVNELSFRNLESPEESLAPNVHTAREWMSSFVQTIRVASVRRWIQGLRTDEMFVNVQLCEGYSLPHWRNDQEVNRDERAFFRRVVTNYPYLNGVEPATIDKGHGLDAEYRGMRCSGLLSAILLDGMGISLRSAVPWHASQLTIQLSRLDPNGAIEASEAKLVHVSSPEQWTDHAEWVKQKLVSHLGNGTEVLRMAGDIFPRLEFCGSSRKQLQRLTGAERYYTWVIESLFTANLECERWAEEPFPHHLLPGPASGESPTVHQNPDLRKARIFEKLDGTRLMFEFHMKNMAENQRIHYLPDPKRRKLMIAYIGDHLPL